MKIAHLKKAAALLAAAAVMLSAVGCSRSPVSEASSSSSVSVSSSSSSASKPVSSSSSEPELPKIEVQDNISKVTDAIAINDDVGAYIYIPDTQIDEPVVCAANYSDSKTFYATYDTTSNRLDWKKESTGVGGTGSLYSIPALSLILARIFLPIWSCSATISDVWIPVFPMTPLS